MKLRRGVQGLAVHLREAGHGQAGVEPATLSPYHMVKSLSGTLSGWCVAKWNCLDPNEEPRS